ncbi:MAG: cysteine methyltransferase [Deltaproteobacteria bacterium]|nr:MAG: cysteine methyltransferase [Deltaproteobacteria bacterium]
MRYYTSYDSSLGPLLLIREDELLSNLYLPKRWTKETLRGCVQDPNGFRETIDQLEEYFNGKRKRFTLDLRLNGTEFQTRVWNALCQIPYGETASYSDIARKVNSPKASRAVGMANHRNPLPIIVPCHRVIGKDGSLTGFGGGLRIKQQLLDLERKSRPV